jgi:uridine phosphorylase
VPPILADKQFSAPSVFEPANLLREARRQKGLAEAEVPEICVLDPDGDILRALRRDGRASLSPAWACYHTDLYVFDHGPDHFGIIAYAVGASFRGVAGRTAIRFGMPVSDQPYVAPIRNPAPNTTSGDASGPSKCQGRHGRRTHIAQLRRPSGCQAGFRLASS